MPTTSDVVLRLLREVDLSMKSSLRSGLQHASCARVGRAVRGFAGGLIARRTARRNGWPTSASITTSSAGCCAVSPDFGVRAQDVSEVAGRDDEPSLAWADKNDRVILTRDLATMAPTQPAFTAIVIVPESLPIGRIIEP